MFIVSFAPAHSAPFGGAELVRPGTIQPPFRSSERRRVVCNVACSINIPPLTG